MRRGWSIGLGLANALMMGINLQRGDWASAVLSGFIVALCLCAYERREDR